MIRKACLFSIRSILIALVLVLSASCALFNRVQVIRPVQAVWDAEGENLLLAESRYFTRRPGAPYFADESAFDWEIRLYMLPRGDKDQQVLTAVIPEDFSAGGSLEYSRIHWDQAASLVSVNDWTLPYIIKLEDSPSAWERISLDPPELLSSLADLEASPEDFYPIDTVLSPDGTGVAVLWEFSYFPTGVFGDLYVNQVLTFYNSSTGVFQYGRRIQKAPDDFPSGAEHIGPLKIVSNIPAFSSWNINTDAPSFSRIMWSNNDSDPGVYLFDQTRREGCFVSYDPDSPSPALVVSQFPDYPLPHPSGPVAPDGTAVLFTYKDNSASWTTAKTVGWIPFSQVELVDASSVTY